MLIQQFICLVSAPFFQFTLRFGLAKPRTIYVRLLYRLCSRNPLFESFYIYQVAHDRSRVLAGAKNFRSIF